MHKLLSKGWMFEADADGGGKAGGDDDPARQDRVVNMKQSELDAQFGERAKRAAAKAQADLLESLGVKTPDEAKARLTELGALKQASLSDQEKAQAALKKAQDDLAAADAREKKLVAEAKDRDIKHAVESAAGKLLFHNPASAFKLTDLTGVEVGEDGKVKGAEEALKKLAKEQPYLVRQGTGSGANINATERGDGKGDLGIDEKEIATRFGIKIR